MEKLENDTNVGAGSKPALTKEKEPLTTARFAKPAMKPRKQDKAGIIGDIKQKLSSFGPDRKKMSAHYDESLVTKTAYFLHLVLVFSGRITRNLMGSYKRIFDFPADESGNIYANLGMDFMAKADYKQAIPAFHKSLELHPENKRTFYYLGGAYFKEKQYKEAINAYLSAINADPDNADAWFELGLSYGGLENYEEAVKAYKKAIDLAPDNDEVYYCLGVSYDQTKEYPVAIENFKKAININPRESRYYHSLGFTFECNKQHDKAIECFKKAIELERE